MTFKDDFLNTPPGPSREDLIYKSLINNGKPINLIPVKTKVPNNTNIEITYFVTSDYLSIDGIRVPMTGATAQRVANTFNMSLPTAKMTKQIYQAADTKLVAQPMSGGATIGGKYYSGKDIVNSKISGSDTSVAFNEGINQQLSQHKNSNLIAGHMKDIVQPENNRLGLYGWYGKDGKPIQYSGSLSGSNSMTPHDTTNHSEYAAGVRLVDNNVIVSDNNKQHSSTLKDVLSDPKLYLAISDSLGSKEYQVKNKKIDNTLPNQSDKGRIMMLKRINDFLSNIRF